MKRISTLMIAVGLIGAFAASAMGAHSVRNGGYRCNRCHVPHSAGRDANGADITGAFGVPLWSPTYNADGLAYTYTLYSSAKFDALQTDIGQPDGAAKMCLGCHDGSYSSVRTPARKFVQDSMTKSHPVSFTYNSALAAKVPNGGLKNPDVAMTPFGGTITADLLDSRGKMQCTSCHNVHEQGVGTEMLRMDYNTVTGTDGDLCRICHNK